MKYIDENIIPANWDWKSAKYSDKQISNNAQFISNTQKLEYVNNVLTKVFSAIENLIVGNQKIGFNHTDSMILKNSIINKCNEILNANSMYIDNNMLMSGVDKYCTLYNNQYKQDCIRLGLDYIDQSIAYNADKGVVRINPIFIKDTTVSWCYAHQSHQHIGDQLISE